METLIAKTWRAHNWLKNVLILLVFSNSIIHSVSLRNVNEHQSFRESLILNQHDLWCQSNCFSIESCDERFGDNFVDLQIQTNHSILDGPGQHLIYDSTYMGSTISKQTFETQFVIDISETSLGISPCKVHMLNISSVGRDYKNVLIEFRLYEVLHEEIFSLTRQIQNYSSIYYSGKVTSATNQLFGLVIPKWDFSLCLAYAMDLVGGNEIKSIDGELVLNQGSYNWCDESNNLESFYCEFERHFEADLHRALSISKSYSLSNVENMIHVLFVKAQGLDSVVISCRFMPLINNETSIWLDGKFNNLIQMIHDPESILFAGNVTFRIDPTWGVSHKSVKHRVNSKRLNRSVQSAPQDKYTRCKDTHRCSRGWSNYNQTASKSEFTTQLHPGGKHEEVFLFADFEDWRQGTKGWEKVCVGVNLTHSSCGEMNEPTKKPRGAHFSPFDYVSLGPSIPSFNTSYNNGLVLNARHLRTQVRKQMQWIHRIEDYIRWMHDEMNVTSLEAHTRFRKDIRLELERTLADYEELLVQENKKLEVLDQSQCSNIEDKDCFLLFNSSNLELSGVINATGSIGITPDGTEVAIWTFDSIDLGREVSITLTGQRAFAILSKSSVNIDTNLKVRPGTLGGFPGGFSIARNDRLGSVCPDLQTRTIPPHICRGDYPLSEIEPFTISNNVNGPGSGSVRVYSFTIKIEGKVVHEVQSIITDADHGQVINGGFILHYNGYSTPIIPHNVTAKRLESIVEDNLNPAKLNQLGGINRDNIVPGIGRVEVSRSMYGTSRGSEWKITFLSAIGNIGVDSSPLTVTNLLNGIGASIDLKTLVNGNSIGGTFHVNFLGNLSRSMQHDISATDMENILRLDLPLAESVSVTRTGYHGERCYDGFCRNGPDQSGGYTWSLIITTKHGNISPTSPTSALFDNESNFETLQVLNNLTGCVNSLCPNITVTRGHEKFTRNENMARPFSLSFGGSGGGFGGFGGKGEGNTSIGMPYGDSSLTNLYGGSGGGSGYEDPFDVTMVGIAGQVRGGSGGGAVEIVAINEITIGHNSVISCDGEQGWRGFNLGGGGGSGGSVLLSANGNINIDGKVTARGGDGATPIRLGDNSLLGGGGGSGGRVALYGKTVTSKNIDVSGGSCGAQRNDQLGSCVGQIGTIFEEKQLGLSVAVDHSIGAFGTQHSLRLESSNSKEMIFWMDPRNHFRTEGPEYVFHNPGQPGRVSFFVRFACQSETPIIGWEVSIALKDKISSQTSTALFVAIGKSIKHWFGRTQSMNEFNIHKSASKVNFDIDFDQWYHVDIRFNWEVYQYNIFVNGYLQVFEQSMEIDSIQSFSISATLSDVSIWLDEIYVGNDYSMNFQCPRLLPTSNIHIDSIDEGRGWKKSEMVGNNIHRPMTRHESHLSERELYNRPDNGGILPFDGEKMISFQSEIKSSDEQSAMKYLKSGTIMTLDVAEVKDSDQNTYFWYREHYNTKSMKQNHLKEHFGGVGACSTTDFKTWKNEGIMLHYVNVTDMVFGSPGPFHIERPAVLFNNATNKFVMWMIIDNDNRTMSMAGVATSTYANGPFTFVRSFYPDGNSTRDQTLHKHSDGHTYLIRTYFATVDYTLPAAVMQPVWESVKKRDGSTNFALSYHRAHYEQGYDDFHDIFLQRWRGEDKPWQIVCINRITKVERAIPYGHEGIDVCDHDSEYKKVIGQGSPLHSTSKDGVKSRFLDPNNEENNVWEPSSVPHMKAQNWKANYEDGSCGKYLIGDDFSRYDPSLPDREAPNRKDCSNIVDNPIHPTLPDKRIGAQETVFRRRAKYIAVSRLTEDYLETTGETMSFEGELENNEDLSTIVETLKSELLKGRVFGKGSTYFEKLHMATEEQLQEWRNMLHQYELKENDKSLYSLACVLDGACPIDFSTQKIDELKSTQ